MFKRFLLLLFLYPALTQTTGIRNEFVGHIHKFMAVLTDTRYKIQGKTVLYVPNECLNITLEEAARNKEYVQRLESKN